MTRPLRAEISLSAARHNYQLARRAAPQSKIFAIVKANAYGHGLEIIANALKDADGFATLELDSAIKLREMGIKAPILMLEGFFSAAEIPIYVQYNLRPIIHANWQIGLLSEAQKNAVPVESLSYFVKANTGMNRLGLNAKDVEIAVRVLHKMCGAANIGLMMHFANADNEKGIAAQMQCWHNVEADAQAALGGHQFEVSLANSAATLRYPQTHRDWIRPGVMLYGGSPYPDQSAESLGLKPVMTLRSEIIAVQELNRGDAVGYGGVFVADKPMRVGIVACGYGDGYPRLAPGGNSHGTPILVEGERTRTVGRVSMDMIIADITDIPGANLRSPVVVWGEGMPADEVAGAAGTVSYELFCAVTPRVPMVAVD